MATQPIPIYSQKETFYVPRFEVYVGGKELQAEVAGGHFADHLSGPNQRNRFFLDGGQQLGRRTTEVQIRPATGRL